MALLGEMHYGPLGPDSWFNLPRDCGVAYAPQESWVLNRTIRVSSSCAWTSAPFTLSAGQDNILLDAPFDEARYRQGMHTLHSGRLTADTVPVIRQCALEQDLSLFEAGDSTEVGEKGITLRFVTKIFTSCALILSASSGGQKVCIVHARFTILSQMSSGSNYPRQGRLLCCKHFAS